MEEPEVQRERRVSQKKWDTLRLRLSLPVSTIFIFLITFGLFFFSFFISSSAANGNAIISASLSSSTPSCSCHYSSFFRSLFLLFRFIFFLKLRILFLALLPPRFPRWSLFKSLPLQLPPADDTSALVSAIQNSIRWRLVDSTPMLLFSQR